MVTIARLAPLLAAAALTGCAPSSSPAPIASRRAPAPSVSPPSPAPVASAPSPAPSAGPAGDLAASVDLVQVLCGDEGESWVVSHAAAHVAQARCAGRHLAWTFDGHGATSEGPFGLGAPAYDPEDDVQWMRADGTSLWLGLRDRYVAWSGVIDGTPTEEVAVRTTILERTAEGWTRHHAARIGDDDATIVGVGRWTGSSALAVLRTERPPWPARVHLLRGDPPTLPRLRQDPHEVLEMMVPWPTGHAFAVAGTPGGISLQRWQPGAPDPTVDTLPGLSPAQANRLSKREPSLLVRSPTEVYVAATVTHDDGERIVVLRFDGQRWSPSEPFAAEQFLGFAEGGDGSTWLLLGPEPESDEGTELHRRSPGPDGTWRRVAPASFGRETALHAVGLVPTTGRDLLVVALLAGAGRGLYRVRPDEVPR